MKYNYEIDQILITAGDGGDGGVGLTVADLAWHEGSVPLPGHSPPFHSLRIARVDRVHSLYRIASRAELF